ncbi:MAG: FtsW/RodA/SpoVE family cell cycle protein [Bacteroidales bacterium]|nr:FtsW/RodA/SpoVE family cell cycle protein [Bacteroidales bacterium]
MTEEKKGFAERMMHNITTGDRMIWIIAVFLMMLSLVAIFSSTSTYAMSNHTSRTVIFTGQLIMVLGGVIILVLMSAIPNIKYLRVLSQNGYWISLVLLLMLVFKMRLNDNFRAINNNEAVRAIYIYGFTLQVYEVVKVAMIMYLSWAITAYESNKLVLANWLGTYYPKYFGWMKTPLAQRWIYIYIPIFSVVGLTFPGSTSSALMVGGVMGVTLIIGGFKFKHILGLGGMGLVLVSILVILHIVSNGVIVKRLQTGFNRLSIELPYPSAEMRAMQREKIEGKKLNPDKVYDMNSPEFEEYRNKTLQNNSAEVAFVQGGRRILGKGPGKSTQKYIVPLIFEDYMFSFLMEEYGMIGAIVVLVLYMSLFARGVIIVNNCSGRYAKTCVGGLVFLISFQAMLHILINCNVGILTGQTLPMISHGKSSFLCFTIAFGVILSISKMANDKIRKEGLKEQQMFAKDDVSSGVSAVEDIDAQFEELDNLQ